MASDHDARTVRAAARRERLLSASPVASSPLERLALTAELSRVAWSLSGRPWPSYVRESIPIRVLERKPG